MYVYAFHFAERYVSIYGDSRELHNDLSKGSFPKPHWLGAALGPLMFSGVPLPSDSGDLHHDSSKGFGAHVKAHWRGAQQGANVCKINQV